MCATKTHTFLNKNNTDFIIIVYIICAILHTISFNAVTLMIKFDVIRKQYGVNFKTKCKIYLYKYNVYKSFTPRNFATEDESSKISDFCQVSSKSGWFW